MEIRIVVPVFWAEGKELSKQDRRGPRPRDGGSILPTQDVKEPQFLLSR